MGFLSSLFGKRTKKHPERADIVGVRRDDKKMSHAQRKVAATIRGFVEELQTPNRNARYSVKVILTEGHEVEHVWLENVKWIAPGIAGVLAVNPVYIKTQRLGDAIFPMPNQITDWVIIDPDGKRRGGFTLDALDERGE